MFEEKKYNVRYFNGKNAIPEVGIAEIKNFGLVLNVSNQSLKFPFEQFHQAEVIHNGIKFIFREDEHQESPTIELFCDLKEAAALEKLWIHNKRGENWIHSVYLFFRNLNKVTIVTLGLVFILLVGSSFYFTLQKIYLFFPIEADEKLGASYEKSLEENFKVCQNKETDEFFRLALKELVPKDSKFKYNVKVIDLPEENAISIAGGRIYFFTGLLKSSESQNEIVGVLAHEISHIEKRHHLRSMIKALGTSFAISVLVGPGLGDFQTLETLTEIGSTIAVLKYSRDFEEEADIHAYHLLANANRDVKGLLQFLSRIHKQESGIFDKDVSSEQSLSVKWRNSFLELMSSHPPTEDRIAALKQEMKKNQKGGARSLVNENKWDRIKQSCTK